MTLEEYETAISEVEDEEDLLRTVKRNTRGE
eukprot:CAMPEP_0205820908 /NCGR_PEP_ID=MMETSP0206-20130828/3713_1 /ASSEMBLY_ACC=CAM_ASM_000279 /TAXON_ID=36767 /ORGANISM="Euplotes focardii, Strain TN1" /LENGTH=30 /DNA_ID= /DNA_START= /DNA_END= /DNA_ORIENTATION=